MTAPTIEEVLARTYTLMVEADPKEGGDLSGVVTHAETWEEIWELRTRYPRTLAMRRGKQDSTSCHDVLLPCTKG